MPAATVSPATIAYIKVVTVEKLVVGFLVGGIGTAFYVVTISSPEILGWILSGVKLLVRRCPLFTVKKLECSKQAYAIEYISME